MDIKQTILFPGTFPCGYIIYALAQFDTIYHIPCYIVLLFFLEKLTGRLGQCLAARDRGAFHTLLRRDGGIPFYI